MRLAVLFDCLHALDRGCTRRLPNVAAPPFRPALGTTRERCTTGTRLLAPRCRGATTPSVRYPTTDSVSRSWSRVVLPSPVSGSSDRDISMVHGWCCRRPAAAKLVLHRLAAAAPSGDDVAAHVTYAGAIAAHLPGAPGARVFGAVTPDALLLDIDSAHALIERTPEELGVSFYPRSHLWWLGADSWHRAAHRRRSRSYDGSPGGHRAVLARVRALPLGGTGVEAGIEGARRGPR